MRAKLALKPRLPTVPRCTVLYDDLCLFCVLLLNLANSFLLNVEGGHPSAFSDG